MKKVSLILVTMLMVGITACTNKQKVETTEGEVDVTVAEDSIRIEKVADSTLVITQQPVEDSVEVAE